MNNTGRILFFVLFFVQLSFSNDILSKNSIDLDSIKSDIDLLLDYNSFAKEIKDKSVQAEFYSEISFALYSKTLNLENNTKITLSQYTTLINDLENRLDIKNTSISYDLGAPIIEYNFKPLSINRKNIKNGVHFEQATLIKEQYLKLVRYSEKIIDIC